MGVPLLGVAVALRSATKNTMTPTHRLLTNLPVSPVYLKIHGEANVQAPNRQLSQLNHASETGFPIRIAAAMTIRPATIQLFHELAIMYEP
jgi:hypothetical protein